MRIKFHELSHASVKNLAIQALKDPAVLEAVRKKQARNQLKERICTLFEFCEYNTLRRKELPLWRMPKQAVYDALEIKPCDWNSIDAVKDILHSLGVENCFAFGSDYYAGMRRRNDS